MCVYIHVRVRHGTLSLQCKIVMILFVLSVCECEMRYAQGRELCKCTVQFVYFIFEFDQSDENFIFREFDKFEFRPIRMSLLSRVVFNTCCGTRIFDFIKNLVILLIMEVCFQENEYRKIFLPNPLLRSTSRHLNKYVYWNHIFFNIFYFRKIIRIELVQYESNFFDPRKIIIKVFPISSKVRTYFRHPIHDMQ